MSEHGVQETQIVFATYAILSFRAFRAQLNCSNPSIVCARAPSCPSALPPFPCTGLDGSVAHESAVALRIGTVSVASPVVHGSMSHDKHASSPAPHRALGLGDGKRRRMGCARVGLRRTGRRARGSWRPTARPRGFPCEIAPGRPARSREISRSRMLTPLVLAGEREFAGRRPARAYVRVNCVCVRSCWLLSVPLFPLACGRTGHF